ncbi:MAG: hypothetical protein ACLPND_08495 [Candidatus Korobacteraceae bacterium]
MLENTQFAAECSGYSSIRVSKCYAAAETEQEQVSLLLKAFHRRLRYERQVRSLKSLASLWPVALGVLLGFYAPLLRDLAASSSPWALTLLFPFSAMVGERGLGLSRDTAQALAQFLLCAQFPLEGLLVRIILKHRLGVFNVFGQVTCLHVVAVVYLALVSGAFRQILGS